MAKVIGGDKLKAYLGDLANKVRSGHVDVGFAEGSTYPDGTSLPMVAALNEFGRPDHNQPPRPFMRNTVSAHSGEWPAGAAGILKRSGGDTEMALRLMGDVIQGQMQETISKFTSPPLSPATVAKKGFSKPLIDTNHMAESVSVAVHMDDAS